MSFRRGVWWMTLLGLLAACASPAPAPSSPTAAPAESAAPTVGASPTLSPTGVPTTLATALAPTALATSTRAETLSADQRLAVAAARLLLVEGDYTSAAERWQALQNVTPDARYFSALSLALGGRGAEALQVLNAGSADPRDGFVRGLALETANQHAQAMQSLAGYATANPAVAAGVWLEIAERELNAGRWRETADATAKGLDTAEVRPLKQRLLDVRAQALAALGDNEAAFDAHRQVLALATSTATLGEQLFHLAQVSRDLGKPDAALQSLQTALDQFPQASTTADALRLLDELGASDRLDPFILGRARYYAVDYRNAVTAFDRYLAANPDGPDAPAARLFKALASLTPGNEPNALKELDALADDPNQDSDLAAQGLLEAGQALEGLAENDQAEAHYARLLDKFPRLDAAALAGFRLGLLRYVRGADAEAIAAWDGLIARRDDLQPEDVARAFYWRGKALTRLGRADDARASFLNAAAVTPSSYYSLRAALVAGIDRSSTDQDVAQWMAARGQDLSTAAGIIASDPALARARADASIGLFREGNWQADELLQVYPDRADRLYLLARQFADLDLVGGSSQLGRAAYVAASIQTPQDAPSALLQLAFPRPFASLSDATAARYGIEPLLLDATLHNASQFDAWSEDVASGARGLAGMSPVHAEEAAQALHVSADDEFRPISAIEHQAWLLSDRLRRFGGRPEVALSAIATTERLVDGWTVRPGADDADAYLEVIDYEGVRAGLRSLLASRLSYGVAYSAASDPLAVAQPGSEPTPEWIKIARLPGDVPASAPLSVAPDPGVGTPDQQAAFARGATLQRDGDYVGAIGIFRDLLSSADSAVAAEARLRLGESLIGGRRPVEAIATLQGTSSSNGSAAFLLGRALADAGRCTDALPVFQAFGAASGPPLAAQAELAQADCLADLGRAGDAVPLLENAVNTSDVARLQTIDFRERLALMRVRAGDIDGARADYQSLLQIARSSSYQSELNYYLGVLATDPSAAAGYYRKSVQLDQKGRGAQAALDELVASRDPFALSFEAGETRFAQNRYREALAAYTTFLQQNPSDKRAPQAVYGRGVSLVRLGQDRAGVAVLEGIADQFPNTADAADGLFRGGRIRESLADLDGASASYQRVLGIAAAGSRTQDAQFRIAFIQFQQGAFAQAAAGWRSLAGSVTAADARAQAMFWLGKALHAQGDEAGARGAWTSASTADPHGFYGLRSADWLAGLAAPRADLERSLSAVRAHADDDPFASLSAWAAGRSDVSVARQRLLSDVGLARADELLAMGLRQPAIWELDAIESRLNDSPAAVALLGAWEQRRGLYHTALLLGYDLASVTHVSLIDGPAPVRRLVYPLVFPAALIQAAEQLHVDPLLFCGLMLQESLLDQSVESSAQARGLSQLIASTAHDAARALGQYDFHASDLYQPKTSITLGAFTFGERLTRYESQIFPALAAYNAAEFAVDGWLLSAGQADIDTFAEAIPFTETYPYVQKIYENYKQYLELYASPSAQ